MTTTAHDIRPIGAPRARSRRGHLRVVRPQIRRDTERATNTQPVPVPVTWGGHTVDAPGFNQDRFERAMTRAFVDDLQVKPLGREAFLVHHPGATHGHRVTRATCTCPAGEHDVPCKHRAIVIAHQDIRKPQLDRRWAKRKARRSREQRDVA